MKSSMLELPEIEFNECELIRSITKDSFFEFVREFWDTIINEKFIYNWHISYLCNELQIIAERVFAGKPKEYDLIINIPPGSSKSSIASVMFPAWIWTRMPSAKFIGTSYGADLAEDLARKNRDIVISDKYKTCWPEVVIREDQNAKSYFLNTSKGFRIAVGTGGITGYHGHFIVSDDPINPKEAASDADLKKANVWMNETLSTRKVDKAVTPTILIMQRLHQFDPTANMLEKAVAGGVKHICLPAEQNDNISPPYLVQKYRQKLLDPVRLSKGILEENKKQLGQYGYAGQFQQHPVPPGGGMFKTSRIQYEIPPDLEDSRKWIMQVRYWDKAATAGAGCFTVGVRMGQDIKKHFWLIDVRRGQWDSNRREDIIKNTAIADGKKVIVGLEQEGGSGGKESVESTVRNLAGWRVMVDRPTGDKISRADTFSVQVNNGNLYMRPAEWNQDYTDEMKYFPVSKYKDQIDASSGAFAILTKTKKVVGALGVNRSHLND
jgi:predicted phage terminase large subunit-like protein